MKLKVQAQHLQPGDIVGSGEKVTGVIISSAKWPSSKVCVSRVKYENSDHEYHTTSLWGTYTMINVERRIFDHKYEAGAYGVCKRCGEEKH